MPDAQRERVFGRTLELDEALHDGYWFNTLRDKIVGIYFEEPHTQSFVEFQIAAMRMGAKPIPIMEEGSSRGKGESLADTVTILSGYVDLVVVRQSLEDAVAIAGASTVPFINAGDRVTSEPLQVLEDRLSARLPGGSTLQAAGLAIRASLMEDLLTS